MTTKYVVLRSAPDGSSTAPGVSPAGATWKVEKMVDAATAKQAVALVVKEQDVKEGTFIATPVRSWKQVKVKTESTVRVKFS